MTVGRTKAKKMVDDDARRAIMCRIADLIDEVGGMAGEIEERFDIDVWCETARYVMNEDGDEGYVVYLGGIYSMDYNLWKFVSSRLHDLGYGWVGVQPIW